MDVDTHLLKLYPRGQSFTGITNSCNLPYRAVSIDSSGNCYVCQCEAWLPVTVGNILDFASLEDIWNSNTAQQLQNDVDQKQFSYCAVKHCFITDKSINFEHYYISINIDESCNLACPTCRRSAINHTSGPLFEQKQKMITHLVKLIDNFKKPLRLVMSGNGDPLASLTMRPLVLNWAPTENQSVKLFTNGLLMKKLLPDSPILPHINEFQISVDAGSQDVYERVRRPGKFSVLQENLQWLSENLNKDTKVFLQFCLSAANAGDIVNFANMCDKYGFVGNITKLDDWGTFDNFSQQDVVDNQQHPLHQLAIEQLTTVRHLSYICLNSYLQNII